jgi:amino acid transporter
VSETEQGQHADEALLHQLGYRQELNRRISGFTNFALSFTVISILAGTLTSYYIGFANGGPIMMSWGWPFVSLMCVVVALAMAELASAMPTAGGLYYWSSKLGTPAWGWFTGWTNLIGLTIGTAAVVPVNGHDHADHHFHLLRHLPAAGRRHQYVRHLAGAHH